MKIYKSKKPKLALLSAGLVLALNLPGLPQTTKADPTLPHTPPLTESKEFPPEPVQDIGPVTDDDLSTSSEMEPPRPEEGAPPAIDPLDPAETRPTPPVLDSHSIPPEIGPDDEPLEEDVSTIEDDTSVPDRPRIPPVDPSLSKPTHEVLKQGAEATPVPEPTKLDFEKPPIE